MTDNTQNQPEVWPEEIKLSKAKDRLEIRFDDGVNVSLAAELLRVESPSAEVQGHGVGQKTTPAGKKNILIQGIESVGNYAIRITFSDGHSTGIFSWSLLYDYATRQEALMAAYEARLAADGGSRI